MRSSITRRSRKNFTPPVNLGAGCIWLPAPRPRRFPLARTWKSMRRLWICSMLRSPGQTVKAIRASPFAHHRAQGLEPEGVGEPPQQLIARIFMDDGLADDRAETGHPLAQPFGNAAAVEREIGAAGALRHQIRPASSRTGTASA